jgi:hypothetical protein
MTMTAFRKPGRSQVGYGPADGELNRALRQAPGKPEADRIAQRDGHEDAPSARKWLVMRSPRGRESR